MKNVLILMAASLLALPLVSGCQQEQPAQEATPKAQAQAPAAAGKSGTVVETMNAAGYTYVQVDTGSEKIWAAAPEFKVAVGDAVVVPEGMVMPNYESKTLQRTFDNILFVDQILIGGEMPQAAAAQGAEGAMPEGHPKVEADASTAGVELGDIAKAKNTVGEVLGAKASFADKEITIRAKVVKYNAQIMGKNWIHLQDGTGSQGANDLAVTTANEAKVGDTVLMTGKLTLDKDFGMGYKYDAIVEDAKVTVE
ncbi:MAG: hypothetical protein C0624_03380 [Desulfuromonas sp.]|nr:MAG: hypothetical protein C0624_03380 [Desulfuromonas sp.]